MTATMEIIDQPEPADVLCGRGENSFRHGGNYQFRQLILEHVNSYKVAATRKQKTQVVMLVAETIVAMGGRFLIRNQDGKSWRDGGLKQGKIKTGHAFRDTLRGRVGRTKCLAYAITPKSPQVETRDLPSTYCSVEPSKDWMTASMDAELEKYLKSIFFLSEGTNTK